MRLRSVKVCSAVLLAWGLLAAAAGATGQARGTLVVAVDASNPPYALVGSDGQTVEGLDADVARAIANVLGYRVVVVAARAEAILPGVASDKYDVGMLSTLPGPRPHDVDLVTYLAAGSSFYVAADGPSVRSFAGLCGRSVAVARATAQAEAATAANAWCRSRAKPGVKLVLTRDAKAAEAALASGRVRVAMADSPVAARTVKRSHGRFRLSGSTDSGAVRAIAIAGGSSLSDEVVGALESVIEDGTYAAILKRWGAQAGAVAKATLLSAG